MSKYYCGSCFCPLKDDYVLCESCLSATFGRFSSESAINGLNLIVTFREFKDIREFYIIREQVKKRYG